MDTAKLSEYDSQTFQQFTNPALIHRDLEQLVGIISGIISDHIVNVAEHSGLVAWLNKTRQYEEKQPYKEIISLIRSATDDNFFSEEEGQNIIWFCDIYIKKNEYLTAITSGMARLQGLIKGIAIDQIISDKEINYLNTWLIENDHLKTIWPYDEIFSLTMKILQDGLVTADEHDEILRFFNAMTFDGDDKSNADLTIALKSGFYHHDPEIEFQEKTFCITGVSRKFKRKELAEKIELYGGFMNSNISKKLHYLVVCDEKNACWAYTCYGKKIEEVMSLRRNGINIVIVHEIDLLDAFQRFE